MSVDRVATGFQSKYMTTQLLKNEEKVNTYSSQVASGKVSNTYAGIGDQTQALESTRAVVNRTTAYQSATALATNQTDLQDTQLTQLSTLASDLKSSISDAVANGDGSSLMSDVQSIFEQASSILNSKDSSGNYIYGGENNSNAPFTATSLSDLVSTLSSSSDGTVSAAFSNGSKMKSVQVADNQTIQIGVSASDIGEDLMNTIAEIASYASDSTTTGEFSSKLDTTTSDTLCGYITDATSAYSSINTATARNGDTYKQLQTASDTQTSMLTMYKTFVSDIEDVDMTTASTNLTNAQTALQAVEKVTASLNSTSLLDYLS